MGTVCMLCIVPVAEDFAGFPKYTYAIAIPEITNVGDPPTLDDSDQFLMILGIERRPPSLNAI